MGVSLEFAMVPAVVLHRRMPDSAKILYGVIYALSQMSDGVCRANNGTLLQTSTITDEKTLWRLLQTLEKERCIQRCYGKDGKRQGIHPKIIFNPVDKEWISTENLGITCGKACG